MMHSGKRSKLNVHQSFKASGIIHNNNDKVNNNDNDNNNDNRLWLNTCSMFALRLKSAVPITASLYLIFSVGAVCKIKTQRWLLCWFRRMPPYHLVRLPSLLCASYDNMWPLSCKYVHYCFLFELLKTNALFLKVACDFFFYWIVFVAIIIHHTVA